MERPAAIVLLIACSLTLGACSNALDMDKVESGIRNGLNEQIGVDAEVDCPDERDAERGDVFRCEVTADGEAATVEVTQQDDEGNINWELIQE